MAQDFQPAGLATNLTDAGSQVGPNQVITVGPEQVITLILVNGFDWKLREVAELLNVGVSTVQSHLERGMRSLRNALEVVEND